MFPPSLAGPLPQSSGAADGLRRQVEAVTGSLRSWLLTGTRRIPIDPRRRKGVHEGLKLILAGDEGGVDSTSQEISQSMKRQAVVEAMNRLPEDESQIIKLAYFGGQTNDEIAATTGIPLHSVRRRLRDGLRQMQAQLESTGVVEITRAGRGRRGLASLLAWLASRYASDPRRRARGRMLSHLAPASRPELMASTVGPVAAAVALGVAALTTSAGAYHLSTTGAQAAMKHQSKSALHTAARSRPAATLAGNTVAGTKSGGAASSVGPNSAAGGEPGSTRTSGPIAILTQAVAHGAASSIAITNTGALVPGTGGVITTATQTAAGLVVSTTRRTLPGPS